MGLIRCCMLSALAMLPLLTGCGLGNSQADRVELVIGRQGHEPGTFNRPRGICFDTEAETLYVVDWDGRIQAFTPDGKLLRWWRMPEVDKGKPETLFLTPERTILVTDTHYSRVVEFSPEGEILQMFGSYGTEPGQFIYPVGVCMDSEGFIYVSEYGENDRVQKFTRDGELVQVWGEFGHEPGQFQRPSGMAFGPDGLLYIADAVNHRVQVFTATGELRRIIGEQGREPGAFTYPYDLAIRGERLFVLEYGGQRVQAFDLRGDFLMAYGKGGREKGEFFAPWRLTATPEWLYVSDTNNNRVLKLDL